MPAEIRTPFTRSQARQVLPHTWRKRVLPVGNVEYKGRTLQFTPSYLSDLAAAFNDRAYDQVPFQLADAANTHTNDPERYRGQIVKVDVEPDGLYVTARTTPDGSKLLATNPNLGVSARIVEGYDRSDGKHYDAAIQHVLGTLDPRIPGLGAWEAVEMSNPARPELVIDLSAATFAGEEEGGISMPDLNAEQANRLARLLELDPDAIEAALAAGGSDPEGDDDDGGDDDDEIAAWIETMSDEEFAQLQVEFEIDTMEQELQPAFSNYGMPSDVELANYRIAETERQLGAVNAELDRQRYENEKVHLVNKLGLTPHIVEMARPLLEGSGHVVELANGQGGVDAGQVMRAVLTEFAKTVQLLDLGMEMGSAIDEPDTSAQAETSRQDFVARYKSVTGLG